MADLKIQGVVEMSSEGAERALDRVADKADQMAGTVAGSAGKAGAAIDNLGTSAGKSAAEFSRAEGRISESIRRATKNIENLGKTASQKLELQISEKGFDAAKFEPALKKLREVEAAAVRSGSVATSSLNNMGLSAGQLSAALRGVPAQFTDIVTSLSMGQAPLTVLLQQGGQLKDMFGGAGNAARALGGYVVDLVSPFTVAAAAAGVLGYAYYKGSSEASEFSRTLILTGNAAGATAGQLMDMSRTIALATGATRGAVSEALNDIAGSGKVSADMLAKVAQAAVDLERTGGQSAAATAKEFASLGDAPADAILKLNDKYHFLTAAVYEQIKALQDQGRETEAARLAQATYADVLEDRSRQMVQNLGYVEKAWKAIAGASKSAIDAVFNVGRDAGLEEQLAKAKRYAENLARSGDSNTAEGRASNAKAQQAIADIEAQIAKQKQLTQAEAEAAKARDAQTKWSVESVKYLDKEAQKKNEILRVTNMMTEAGKSQAEIAKVIAQVEEKYAEKKSASVKALKEDYSDLFGRQKQMALITKALKAETDEIAKANEEYAKSVASLLGPIEKEAESLERQLETYGMTRAEIEATTIARLEEAKALATLNGAGDDAIAFYEREIAARKRIQAAAAGIDQKKAWDESVKESKKAAEKAADEWQKSSDKISDSITDALMRGFESGKSFAENLRDATVNMFNSMVLQPVIKATVVGGLSAIGLAPSGSAASTLGSAGNLYSAGSSAYSLYNGGYSSLYSSAATSSVGQSLGLGTTVYDATADTLMTGTTALGETVGAAIPYVGAAIAAVSLLTSALGKRGGSKTEGDAYATLASDGALMLAASDRTGDNWITGTNSNAVVESLLTPIGTSVANLISSMGGSALGINLNLGYSTDPKGTAADNIQSGVMDAAGNYVYRNGRNAERGTYSTELALETQRMMVAAVKAADVSQIYKDVAGSVDLYTASATELQTVLSNLTAITSLRTAFDNLGLGADNLSMSLINAAGGTSALATNLDSYYQNFYSTAERNANTLSQVSDALSDLGMAMPTTREGFRALVDAQDLTTESGQKAFATLMSLNSAFASVVSATEATTTAVETLSETIKDSMSSAQTLIDSARERVQSAYDTESSALETTISSLESFGDSIKSLLNNLATSDLSPYATPKQFSDVASDYELTLKKSILGDADAQSRLPDLANSYLTLARQMYGSGDAYTLLFEQVKSDMSGVASSSETQLSMAKQQLESLKDQAAGILTLNDTVLSFSDAVTAYLDVIATNSSAASSGVTLTNGQQITNPTSEQKYVSNQYSSLFGRNADAEGLSYWAGQISSGKSTSAVTSDMLASATATGSIDQYVTQQYKQLLGKDPDSEGLAYWVKQIESGTMAASDLPANLQWAANNSDPTYADRYAFYQKYGRWPSANESDRALFQSAMGRVPKFESGGYHAGGLRLVGETGVEIEATGPARYWNASQTSQMISGSNPEMLVELRALRDEVKALRQQQQREHREDVSVQLAVGDKVVSSQQSSAYATTLKSRYAA